MPSVTLLTAATATTTVPSAVEDGVDITSIAAFNKCSLQVKSTAGSGTMTCTLRLRGWSPEVAKWLPLGPGADSTKGTINLVSALGETAADVIGHEETFQNFKYFTRMDCEVVAIGGTATAITVMMVV